MEGKRRRRGGAGVLGGALVAQVAQWLRSDEVEAVARVCRAWHAAVGDAEDVWARAFAREFGGQGAFRLKDRQFARLACAMCLRVQRMLERELRWELLEGDELHPCARQGTALAAARDGSGAFLFGGWTETSLLMDCWAFDNDQATWKMLGAVESLVATYGHVLTPVTARSMPGGHVFMCTGGVTHGGYMGASNRVVMFHLNEDWSGLTCNCIRPTYDDQGTTNSGTKRAYHSATEVFRTINEKENTSSQVLLFGGFNDFGPLTHLELYDIDSDTFIDLAPFQTGTVPKPRFGHSVVLLEDSEDGVKLLVSGGSPELNNIKGHAANTDHEDMFILSLTKRKQSVESENSNDIVEYTANWLKLESPVLPTSALRRLHSATRIGKDLIMFMGGGSTGFVHNNIVVLRIPQDVEDIKQWKAFIPEISSRHKPGARQNHGFVWLPNDRILLFGGCTTESTSEELGDTWVLPLA